MRFTAQTKEFKTFIQGVTRIAKKNQVQPGLEGVRLVLEGTRLTATARDLNNFISSQISVQGKEDGSLTVTNSHVLSSFLSKASSDTIEIMFDGKSNLLIKDGSARIRIPVTHEDVIGNPPDSNVEVQWILPQRLLRRVLQTTQFAVGADQSRPNLLGIRFCATKGTLWAVGTNASMLSYMKVDGEFANGAFTLPIEMVSHVLTWMDESDDPVTLDVGDYIRITAGNTVLFARKLEGHYPDFFRLVDTPFEYEVQTSREALLAELERAKLIDQYVTLKFDDGRITVTSTDQENGSFFGEIAAEVNEPGSEAIYNADFLLAALRVARDEKITLCMNKELLPGGIKTSEFTLLVMPIRRS